MERGFCARTDRSRVSSLPHPQGLRRCRGVAGDDPSVACRGGPAFRDPYRKAAGERRRRRSGARLSRQGVRVGGRVRSLRIAAVECGRRGAPDRRAASGRAVRATSKGAAPAVGGAAEAAGALPEWAQTLIRTEGAAISRDKLPHRPCAVCYEPHAGCFFDGDDTLQLIRKIPGVLAVRIEPRAPWPPLADSIRRLQPSPVGDLRRGCSAISNIPLGAGSGANCRGSGRRLVARAGGRDHADAIGARRRHRRATSFCTASAPKTCRSPRCRAAWRTRATASADLAVAIRARTAPEAGDDGAVRSAASRARSWVISAGRRG